MCGFLMSKKLHCLININQLDSPAKSLLKDFCQFFCSTCFGEALVQDVCLLTVRGYFSVALAPFGGVLMTSYLLSGWSLVSC